MANADLIKMLSGSTGADIMKGISELLGMIQPMRSVKVPTAGGGTEEVNPFEGMFPSLGNTGFGVVPPGQKGQMDSMNNMIMQLLLKNKLQPQGDSRSKYYDARTLEILDGLKGGGKGGPGMPTYKSNF